MNSNYFFVLYISATVFSINTTVVKSYDANIKLGDRNNHNDGNINYIMKNVWLEPDYNSHNPPSNKYGKTNVDMDWFKVPKILSIDEKNNKITLQLDQYMEWEDSRVKVNYSAIPTMIHPYSYMKIPPDKMKELWHPNLDMFTNDILEWKSLHDPFWFQSAGIFKCPWTRNCDLTPQATLLYALKMWRVTLYCEFDFSTFPLDTQHCKFKQAFGSTSETVGLFVYPQQSLMFKNNRTKQAGNWTFAASGYTVMINPTGSLVESNTLDQNDTVDFGFDIRLQRIFQPYLFQYYIPCIAIVLVSMISFLIPLTAIPGRVTLVVTLFLTLTNIFTVELSNSPSGAGLNALGEYLLISLCFVVLIMLEFALVLIVKRRGSKTTKYSTTSQQYERKIRPLKSDKLEGKKNSKQGWINSIYGENYSLTDQIDFLALIINLIAYALFNCVYFATFM